MVNPGAFRGSRKKFLEDQAALYSDALLNNHVADTVSDIQRRFFKRYPITLPHNEEPSEEWLAQVNDDAPDCELDPPNRQSVDAESYNAALATYNEQLKLIKSRKEQIARRLKYQHSKRQDVPSKFKGKADDPMFVLMANLTGSIAQKPRRKTGYHMWGPSNRPALDALVEQRAEQDNITGRQKAGLRTKIYKEAWDELGVDEQAEWEAKAAEKYEEELSKYEDALDSPPSTKPEDRQRVINALPRFAQPILDLISDYTGWKVTLIAGGPEPADNGRLNMVSMHSGTTTGYVTMNFGRSERGSYKKFVVPVFANFLKKCYTVEECRAAALSTENESLADVLKADNSGWEIHSTDDYIRLQSAPLTSMTPNAATPRQPLRDFQGNAGDTSNQIEPYKIPEKVGPPIHARRKKSSARAPQAAQALLATFTSPPPHEPSPVPSRLLPSRTATSDVAQSELPAPPSCTPSCTPSRAPSPPPSRAPSPAPSHAPSPVLPPVPLQVTSRAPSPPFRDPSRAPSTAPSPGRAREPSPVRIRDPSPVQPRSPSPIRSPSPPHTLSRAPSPAPSHAPFRASSLPLQVSPPKSSKRARDSDSDDLRRRMRLRLSEMQSQSAVDVDSQMSNVISSPGLATANNAASTSLLTSTQDHIASSNTAAPSTHLPLISRKPIPSPEWFNVATAQFRSKDLGNAWHQLLTSWTQFEEASMYTENGTLGTKGRPPLVSEWIRYARSPKYSPKTLKLNIVSSMFWAWWRGLQPEWRADDGSGVLPRSNGDLMTIRKPGKNGLLSVLALLFYWGIEAQGKGSRGGENDWKDAVDDVDWVIRGLLLSS
ncbi:hypothetical protein BDN70DRAFT_939042 [Pholiota conissans]|uniref:Uncharacterized protein n=1 Tax=Pholiota conissans TaxID=109636 RepID=A0A9P6CSQ5_9AGAR|nr:hypothetical protein BDN70DRAFT_939042 [Pholiota conissans]